MAEHSNGAFRTSIGGQALIEGILMRGPEKQAIVVRDKDGRLVEKVEELKFIKDRYPILGVPLIRGTVNFLAAMVSGVKALMYSADFYPDEEVSQPSKFEQWLEAHLSSEKLEKAIVAFAVLLGVGLSIFLFLVLPTLLTGGILHFFPGFPLWGRNVVEGLLKIVIFLAYLILCSKQKDIYRVFQYHGAAPDGGKRPHPAPAPSPLRHQLFVCGDFRVHSGIQRGVRHLAHHQRLAPDPGAFDPAAPGGGHYLRVQPLGGPSRAGQRACQAADGPRHVDAEFHHQRAGRLHDRMCHPFSGTGATQRKGQGRVVNDRKYLLPQTSEAFAEEKGGARE